MRSGGVALDGDCREGGTFAFSAIVSRSPIAPLTTCTYYIVRVRIRVWFRVTCM